jgi:hypothetical protein
MEPEDLLISRLRRMDADQLAQYVLSCKGVDDEQFQLDTGWTRQEAILEIIGDISRKMDLEQ